MKSFLSVDIDYWNGSQEETVRKNLENLHKVCSEKQIKISAVMNHQQMLPLVNSFCPTKLINIDYHSDLTDNSIEHLNCGTWVSYVKNRAKSEYVWFHPNSESDGDCNGYDPIFYKGKINLEFEESFVEWGSVQQINKVVEVFNFKKMLKDFDVGEVCVCLSPEYCFEDLEPAFFDWIKKNKIPYKKGRRNESYGRRIKPDKI
jgi:hypothetical protein